VVTFVLIVSLKTQKLTMLLSANLHFHTLGLLVLRLLIISTMQTSTKTGICPLIFAQWLSIDSKARCKCHLSQSTAYDDAPPAAGILFARPFFMANARVANLMASL